MKKIVFLMVLFPFICFSQVEKIIENSHEVTIQRKEISQFEKDLYERLSNAKKIGNENNVKKIESELKRFYQNDQKDFKKSGLKQWKIANDIRIERTEELILNYFKEIQWDFNTDYRIAYKEAKEKSVSIACRENGDLYAVYEDYGYSKTRIHIKKSTDKGQTWNTLATIYNNDNDLYYPCAVIGEGNKDNLFISFYRSSKDIVVASYEFSSNAWVFVTVESAGENIRPRIAVDTDNYYYIYVTWIEEDWPLADDLYFSRSTDYGLTFSSPTKLLGGVENNLDIGWGNDNLYIVYQADGWPGKIKLIKCNDAYGGSFWSEPALLSTDADKYIYPRIAVSDHNDYACVTYTYLFSDTDYDLLYARTLNGNSWSGNYVISTSGDFDETLADIYYMPYNQSGDNFHVAWNHGGYIKYCKTDTPNSWGASIFISDDSNNSNDDFVSVEASINNEGIVAWVYKFSSNDYDIHFDAEWMPVPVELSSFATIIESNKIILNWTTATETNNYGFDIERSQDKINFIKIGFVEGNGTSTIPQSYSYIDKDITNGNIYYRLKQININGSFEYSNIIEAVAKIPQTFKFDQNYPNPFNPVTIIKFQLPKSVHVEIRIYNFLGQEIRTLLNEKRNAGHHQVIWDGKDNSGKNVGTGTYLCQMKTDDFVEVKKMTLIR